MKKKRRTGHSWGIIRYAPFSGTFPEDDAAAFDGWYSIREWALAIAKDWVERYPRWIVVVVREDHWASDSNPGDFESVDHRPLTTRERKF